MRSLDRDRRRVFVSRFVSTEAEIDAGGRYTGRNVRLMADPEETWPTVSAVRGEAVGDYFGQALDYDRALVYDDPDADVREADALWVDADPGDPSEEGYPAPHDYVVRKVARQGGFAVVAAKRVEVSR